MPTIAHKAESLATLLGLVSAGCGYTIFARSTARLHVDNVASRLFATEFTSSLWLAHNDDISMTARAFREIVFAKQ